MQKDHIVQSYNKKYVRELDEGIARIKPYLVDAFARFYGKEYRDQIEYIMDHLSLVYFISEEYMKLILQGMIGLSNQEKRVLHSYLNYLMFLDRKASGICEGEQIEKFCLQRYIVKSDLSLDILLKRDTICYLGLDRPLFTFYPDLEEKGFYKTIFLPIYVTSLEAFIHEINHAVMSDLVALAGKEEIQSIWFGNQECEELFNDIIAYSIFDDLLQNLKNIPKVFRRFDYSTNYEFYFYLIEDFYAFFEEVIKKSIMEKNPSYLLLYTGEEEFKKFCSLIQKHYLNEGCSEEEYLELMELVSRMREHALKMEPFQYDDYFKQLEKEGYRVRRLKK